MKDEHKTKKQLIDELNAMRQQLDRLEKSEAGLKSIEEALRKSENQYKKMIDAVTAYTYTVEVREGRAISTWHSIGCIPITGYKPEDYESNPYLWHSMIHPDDKIIVENSIKEILKGRSVSPIEHRIFKRNRDLVWIRNTIVPYYDEKGMLIKYDGLIEDITERKQLENKLERLATIDGLTQAFNRTKFQEVIKIELERAKRYKHPLSMLMFDIDHFKAINDTYGHSVGDYVLQTLSKIAKDNLRDTDYLVRWGGEEFIIITPETELERAKALAERIRTAIENYRFDRAGRITISFGVTEFKESDTEDTFIRRADDAMYKAKEKGRNRVEVEV